VTRLSDLAARLAGLEADALKRTRRRLESPQGVSVTIDGRDFVSFCSNDYLGLAAHPGIARAVEEGVRRYGTGAGASHLLTGHTDAHEALERDLARFSGFPAALLFSTGYMANLGIATALLGRGDAVFGDRLNHACLNDGALLSRATFHRHPHGDLASLERQLAGSDARVRMIMVDGVFSMDGDIAPLPELLELAARHDAWLLVDDAHGFGVLGGGRGCLAHFGIEPSDVLDRVIYMGTLGKAAGVFGAFVAAAPEVIDTLVQSARTYVFTTALPPMIACGLQESLQGILDDHSAFFNCSFSFAVHNETTELALTSGANNYGTPTTSRLTPDNQIPVGSTTKMYTAVAVILSWVYWLKGMQPGDETKASPEENQASKADQASL
jgi:8-amino-7-oxononanoate synthase